VFGDTWRCSICKEERPDAFISVVSRDVSKEKGMRPGTIIINVKYCNDKEECVKKAPTYALI
jgi:hypothetical protein